MGKEQSRTKNEKTRNINIENMNESENLFDTLIDNKIYYFYILFNYFTGFFSDLSLNILYMQ